MDIPAGPPKPDTEEIHLQESLGTPVQDGTLPAVQILADQTGETGDEEIEEGRAPLYIP